MGLEATAKEVELVSYNVRYASRGDFGFRSWKNRGPKVVDFLKERGASVVGLQEVLVGQLRDLEKGLDGYGRVGVGRADGKEGGEFSPIFYNTELWEVGESGTFWFSDTPDQAGSVGWGTRIPRICTWARLLDGEGKGIYVFNVHWDHRSGESRVKSGRLLRERISGRKFKDDPVVVMGDFNCVTGSAGMKALVGDGDLVKENATKFKTFHVWAGWMRKGLAIDHILTSPGLRVKKAEVVGNGRASDHHPVSVVVEVL